MTTEPVYINVEERISAIMKKGKSMSKREFIKLAYFSGAHDVDRGKIKIIKPKIKEKKRTSKVRIR